MTDNQRPELTLKDAVTIAEKAANAVTDEQPNIHILKTVSMIQKAVSHLQKGLETGDPAGLSWEVPFLQLDYDIEPEELSAGGWIFEPETGETPEDRLEHIPEKDQKAFFSGMNDSELNSFIFAGLIRSSTIGIMRGRTNDAIFVVDNISEPDKGHWRLPSELTTELDSLSEEKETEKMQKIAAGYEFKQSFPGIRETDKEGEQPFEIALVFAIRPLTLIWNERAFFPVQIGLECITGDLTTWTEEERAELWKSIHGFLNRLYDACDAREDAPEQAENREPDSITPIERFSVPGKLLQTSHRMPDKNPDLFSEELKHQTPLKWSVLMALFASTDIERIQDRMMQEISLTALADKVYCLTETGAPPRGKQRNDILAEVVKLHTEQRYYYKVEPKQVGRRASKSYYVQGSTYAISAMELVFVDRHTGKHAFPNDAALREFRQCLEIKGKKARQLDGNQVSALPKDRYRLESIRWNWAQVYQDDLLRLPSMYVNGNMAGLPMKTTSGAVIRKGYSVGVPNEILNAFRILRSEGSGNLFACTLLLLLAGDIRNPNKTEYNASRLFRQLGINNLSSQKKLALVAKTIWRLKQQDIRALLPGSDEYPRTDPNPDRRKTPYYRLKRAPQYIPKQGFATKQEMKEIEAENATTKKAKPEQTAGVQASLPGLDAMPGYEIPSGVEIRLARKAAGITIREFARKIGKKTSYSTWARYEQGKHIRVENISYREWNKVRKFCTENKTEKGEK